MVARFADDLEVAARAPVLRTELLAAGERELVSYEPVLRATTKEARDRALSEASEAPLAIARAAAEIASLAAQVMDESKPALRGDAAAGVLLAEAAAQAAVELVDINLRGAPDDSRLAEAARLRAQAARARERVEA
jgi:formiminotetrahydrofolate cyclodeaminase